MSVTVAGVSATISTIAASAASVLPGLVALHVLTASAATVAGGILAALAAGWHGNNAISKRQAKAAPAVLAQAIAAQVAPPA